MLCTRFSKVNYTEMCQQPSVCKGVSNKTPSTDNLAAQLQQSPQTALQPSEVSDRKIVLILVMNS